MASANDARNQFVRRVGIFSKPGSSAATELVPELLHWLDARSIESRLDKETAQYAGVTAGLERAQVPDGCDLCIVLGGDGTLLSAARAVGSRGIPILAVNLGGLGFLTSIQVNEFFPQLERAIDGIEDITGRKMLCVHLRRNGNVIAEYHALNDVVIAKSNIARMIDLEAWAGESLICEYKADGLIISSPTGSTAYSLSAGGPIVYPTVNAICVTPICPHTLTNRPLILPSDMSIRILSRAKDDDAYLTVDGQVGSPLERGDAVECSISGFEVRVMRTPDKTFFEVLRQKLKWGER